LANYIKIVWNYEVHPKHKEKFEFEYGPKGVWNSFFSKSRGFVSSKLCVNELKPNNYMVIDTFSSLETYTKFLKSNYKMYQKLSSDLKHLYVSEEKVGVFKLIT